MSFIFYLAIFLIFTFLLYSLFHISVIWSVNEDEGKEITPTTSPCYGNNAVLSTSSPSLSPTIHTVYTSTSTLTISAWAFNNHKCSKRNLLPWFKDPWVRAAPWNIKTIGSMLGLYIKMEHIFSSLWQQKTAYNNPKGNEESSEVF